MTGAYLFRAKLWRYKAKAAWFFVTLPKGESKEIREKYGKHMKGWRSVPVMVTIGRTSWKTSIFPDSKAGAYILPVKAEVRKKERLEEDQKVSVSLAINVAKYV